MTHYQMPSPPPGQEVCDFCSAQPVRWRYPARPHVMGEHADFQMRSADDWAACDTCHDLIERTDRDGLTRHSAERYARLYGGSVEQHLPTLRMVHDHFWAAREGAPEPHAIQEDA